MTKDQLIKAVQDYSIKLGKSPTRDEFRSVFRNADKIIREHFESFKDLLEAANVEHRYKAEITPPELPSDDLETEEIISSMVKRFEKRHEAHTAKKWMEFKVDTDLPIGITFFGDPHIDDDGCNWPLLMQHIAICRDTPGMYGANIGDTHNNWVGRLAKEYANQNTSRGTAWKLIEWFFKESGVKWLLILLGNHDAWNFGSETMSQITKNVCTMVDWRAQIKLVFKNKREVLIDAAHDHSGHSQWNSLHAQQKASVMGGVAHFYIAGHKHNWAVAQNECPHTNRIYWLARARGYKHIDHYGENLGFGSQKQGAAITIVIDPKAKDVNMIRVFADPKEGAEYLTYLRERSKA